MARVAMLVSNSCTHDARVIKTARAVRDAGHEVHIFATLSSDVQSYQVEEGITYHRLEWKPVPRLLAHWFFIVIAFFSKALARGLAKALTPYLRYALYTRVFSAHVSKLQPHVIHAHDLICLPAAHAAARDCGAAVIYDAHELETHRNPPLPILQRLLVSVTERWYGRRASAVITVGDSIAKILNRHIGRTDVNVIYNTPIVAPCPRNIRTDLGVDANQKVIVYVGKVTMGRGVAEILKLLPKIRGAILATVGPCDNQQRAPLVAMATRLGISDRFRILPAVPFEEVVEYITGANLGVISVEPVTLSYRLCMPNKLFELSFARVPILANDLDDVKGFLNTHKNGLIVDFEDEVSLVYTIERILSDPSQLALTATASDALERNYSWRAQAAKLGSIYARLISGSSTGDDGRIRGEQKQSQEEPSYDPKKEETMRQASLLVANGERIVFAHKKAKSDRHVTLQCELPQLPPEVAAGEAFFFCEAVSTNATLEDRLRIIQASFGKDQPELRKKLCVPEGGCRFIWSLGEFADAPTFTVFQNLKCKFDFEFRNIGVIAKSGIYRLVAGKWRHVSKRIERSWSQSGTRCNVKTTLGNFYAEMPTGWKLSEVSAEKLAAADQLLFGEIEQRLFGSSPETTVQAASERPQHERPSAGDRVLLAFSAGEDSAAALALLPKGSPKFFCKRDYTTYRIGTGQEVQLPSFEPFQRVLDRVGDVVIVPNTFEKIDLLAGGRHGYRHNFGYAVIGLLLADSLGATSIAFGSVMEQVFMGSGNNFIDVAKTPSSRANHLVSMFRRAGMDFCLPTAGCSEVVTNRLARQALGAMALSCPNLAKDGTPCGRCFKCFRKLRFLDNHQVAPHDDVLHILEKHPLKSATSVMYAIQKSGFRHPQTDKYLKVDLSFLERYFGPAVDHFVPTGLRGAVLDALKAAGIRPMSPSDEISLRGVGRTFFPERFNPKRSGLS